MSPSSRLRSGHPALTRAATALTLTAAAALTALLLPDGASALPRFAARSGADCILCHVNPSGGGPRSAYGRTVFERARLALDTSSTDPESDAPDTDLFSSFTGDVTDWLAIGGDFRLAYIWVRPDRGITPGADPDITNSFFLMQADLYHTATLGEHVSLVLDIGVYSGFEAWALFRLRPEPGSWDFMVKAGRFMPPFGVREVEHQLFTREGVGLGASDRDSGLEATLMAGPVQAQLAVLNGTLGDTAFDGHGSDRRTFELAVVGRLSARANLGWFRGQIGADLYYNQDINAANPLFGAAIAPERLEMVSKGLNETRLGGFLTANVGPFTYLLDYVRVSDAFYAPELGSVSGYAMYQELSFRPVQGLEMIGTVEFADRDLDIHGDAPLRVGAVVELFPLPFTELRVMLRRMWSDASPTRGSWDLVVFTHVFM